MGKIKKKQLFDASAATYLTYFCTVCDHVAATRWINPRQIACTVVKKSFEVKLLVVMNSKILCSFCSTKYWQLFCGNFENTIRSWDELEGENIFKLVVME